MVIVFTAIPTRFLLPFLPVIVKVFSTQNIYVLSKQLLRSGTSIGANIRESRFAQSPADFESKLSIALKEAEETQ